jgi:hypothetical protein
MFSFGCGIGVFVYGIGFVSQIAQTPVLEFVEALEAAIKLARETGLVAHE